MIRSHSNCIGRLLATAVLAGVATNVAEAQQAYDPFKGSEAKSQAPTAAGDISGPKDAVDFGAVQSGRDRVTRAISLTNEGGLTVKVTAIKLAAPDDQIEISQQSCIDRDLPAGAKCTIAVTWRPSRPGRLDNVVLVEHTGRTRNITVPVKGQAQAPGFARRSSNGDAEDLILASPDKVDFGSPSRGSLSSNAVLITNIDEQPITISRVELVGNPSSLKVSDDACSKRELEPGRACLIALLYTPAVALDLSINMVVHHSGPRGYVVIPVTGKAPNGESQLAGAPAAAASTQSGLLPSLIPDEPTQPGPRLRLRGTSGKNAIIERNGRTHLITDGKTLALDGVSYKIAVSDGSVMLTTGNLPPIVLDGETLPPALAKTPAAPEPDAAGKASRAAPKPALPPGMPTPTPPSTATSISPASPSPKVPQAGPKPAPSLRNVPELAIQPITPSTLLDQPVTQAAAPALGTGPIPSPLSPRPAAAATPLPQPKMPVLPAPASSSVAVDPEPVSPTPERVSP